LNRAEKQLTLTADAELAARRRCKKVLVEKMIKRGVDPKSSTRRSSSRPPTKPSAKGEAQDRHRQGDGQDDPVDASRN
jgi:uncharacterized protein YajQ (UPF0234 family)